MKLRMLHMHKREARKADAKQQQQLGMACAFVHDTFPAFPYVGGW